MQTKNSSKSGIFLMELILSILFFSIAAAVCVKLFVTAHRLSDQSVNLNHAVSMAESIAEAFYVMGMPENWRHCSRMPE